MPSDPATIDRFYRGNLTESERMAIDMSQNPAEMKQKMAISHFMSPRIGEEPINILNNFDAMHRAYFDNDNLSDSYNKTLLARGQFEDFLMPAEKPAPLPEPRDLVSEAFIGVQRGIAQLGGGFVTGGLSASGADKTAKEAAELVAKDLNRLRPDDQNVQFLRNMAENKGTLRQAISPTWWAIRGSEMVPNFALFGTSAIGISNLTRTALGTVAGNKSVDLLSKWAFRGKISPKIIRGVAETATVGGTLTAGESVVEGGMALAEIQQRGDEAEKILDLMDTLPTDVKEQAIATGLFESTQHYQKMIELSNNPEAAGRVAADVMRKNVLLGVLLNTFSFGTAKVAVSQLFRGGKAKNFLVGAVTLPLALSGEPEQELRQDEIVDVAILEEMFGRAVDSDLFSPRILEAMLGDDQDKKDTALAAGIMGMRGGAVNWYTDIYQARSIADAEAKIQSFVEKAKTDPEFLKDNPVDPGTFIQMVEQAPTVEDKIEILKNNARQVIEKNLDTLEEEKLVQIAEQEIEAEKLPELEKKRQRALKVTELDTPQDQLKAEILQNGGLITVGEDVVIPSRFKKKTNKEGWSLDQAFERAKELNLLKDSDRIEDVATLLEPTKRTAKPKSTKLETLRPGAAIDTTDGTAVIIAIDDDKVIAVNPNDPTETFEFDPTQAIEGEKPRPATREEFNAITAEHGDAVDFDVTDQGAVVSAAIGKQLRSVKTDQGDFDLFDIIDSNVRPTPGQRATTQQIEAEVQRLDLPFKSVSVVESDNQLPKELQGLRVRGVFRRTENEVILNAEQIKESDIARVILHEVAGHAGLTNFFGEQRFDQIIDQSLSNDEIRTAAKQIAAIRNLDFNDPVQRRIAAEEIFAQVAENPQSEPTLWQRIVAAIRQALRDMGFTQDFAVSEQDIKVMIARANAKGAQNAQNAQDGSPRFSIAPPVESEAFKNWFGDSKVVDENGKPLVVYHGTNTPINFNAFSVEAEDELGAHFSIDANVANQFAHRNEVGGRVFPVYLSIQNPLRLIDEGVWSDINVIFQAGKKGVNFTLKEIEKVMQDQNRLFPADNEEWIKKRIESAGFDGIVYLNRREFGTRLSLKEIEDKRGLDVKDKKITDKEFKNKVPEASDAYIAFSQGQVKSLFNVGTFDPANPDIRFSLDRDDPNDVVVNLARRRFLGEDITIKDVREALKESGLKTKNVRAIFDEANTLADFLETEREQAATSAELGERLSKPFELGFSRGQFLGEAKARVAERKKARKVVRSVVRSEWRKRSTALRKTLNTQFQNEISNTVELQRKAKEFMVSNDIEVRERNRVFEKIVNLGKARREDTKRRRYDDIIETLMALKRKAEQRKDIERFHKLAKKMQLVKKKNRIVVGPQTAESREFAKRIQKLAKMKKEDYDIAFAGIHDRIAELRQTNEDAKADALEDELKELETFGALRGREPEEAHKALEEITRLEQGLRAKYQEKIDEDRDRWNEERFRIRNLYETPTDIEVDEKKLRRKGRIEKIKETLSGFLTDHLSLEQKLDKLTDLDISGDIKTVVDSWKRRIWDASNKERTINRNDKDAIDNKIIEIWELRKQTKKEKALRIRNAADQIYSKLGTEEISFTRSITDSKGEPTGRRVDMTLTVDQALNAYLVSRQPGLKDNMAVNGFDTKAISEIEEQLSPKVLELGDWMLKNLDNEYNVLNEIYKSMFGTDMPRNEKYFPFAPVRDDQSESTLDIFNRSQVNLQTISRPGPFHARVKHNMRIDLQRGATASFIGHKANMARVKAHAINGRDFFAIFGEKNVKAAIKFNLGNDFYNSLMNHAQHVVEGGDPRETRIRFVDQFRGFFVYKALIANVGVFFKQLSSFPAFWAQVGTVDFFKMLAEGVNPANFKDDYAKLIATDFIQNRWSQGNHIEAQYILQNGMKPGFVRKAAQLGMITTQAGDLAPILFMGRGLYKNAFKEARLQGKSVKEAEAYAEFVFGSLTEQTQQSSQIKDQTKWQRGGSWGRVFSMFQTSLIQYNRIALRSVQRAMKRRDAESIADAALTTFVMYGILPAMFTFISEAYKSAGLGEPEDDEINSQYIVAILQSPFAGLFVMRYIADNVVEKLATGKIRFQGGADIPILGLDKDIIQLYEAGKGIWQADDKIEAIVESAAKISPAIKQAKTFKENRID